MTGRTGRYYSAIGLLASLSPNKGPQRQPRDDEASGEGACDHSQHMKTTSMREYNNSRRGPIGHVLSRVPITRRSRRC